MLHFRPFYNTDPSAVTAVWRSREGRHGFLTPVSVDVFEQYVFAKTYFDRAGLILALDDGRPVGFAHASFGPAQRGARLDRAEGVIAMVAALPEASLEVVDGLLARCEEYLIARGAKTIWGGPLAPRAPFYFGLYGGCEPLGVLDSDMALFDAYRRRGYETAVSTRLLRRRLDAFRPPMDRQQAQLRRQLLVQAIVDPPTRTWWDACLLGEFDCTRFEALSRGVPQAIATVVFRAMDLTEPGLPGRGGGVLALSVDPAQRRRGVATYLVSEAFRALAEQGVSFVEAVAAADNAPALGLLAKLQMETVARGTVFRKTITPPAGSS